MRSWPSLHHLVQRMETLVFELRPWVDDMRAVATRSRLMCTCYEGKTGARYTKVTAVVVGGGRGLGLPAPCVSGCAQRKAHASP